MNRWQLFAALVIVAAFIGLRASNTDGSNAPQNVASTFAAQTDSPSTDAPRPTNTPVDEMCKQGRLYPDDDLIPESGLTNETDESTRTKLFDNPIDRCAQLHALKEDNEGAEVQEIRKLSQDDCSLDGEDCSSRGYIISVRKPENFDRVGRLWAALFSKYHPNNRHCALILLVSEPSQDLTKNDDYGNKIDAMRCYPHR